MRTSYPDVFVDHERNLSSTEKSVFHLGLWLLRTDILLEVGVHDDLFQVGRNLRIKHPKIRERRLQLTATSQDRPLIRPSPLL